MFNLKSFDTKTYADRGVEMTLKLLDGEPAEAEDGTPVTITVAGSDRDVYHRAARVQRNQILEAKANGVEAGDDPVYEAWIDVLVACTLDWKGLADDNGPLPCTPENARRLYDQFPVVREQVDRFILDRRNFLHG